MVEASHGRRARPRWFLFIVGLPRGGRGGWTAERLLLVLQPHFVRPWCEDGLTLTAEASTDSSFYVARSPARNFHTMLGEDMQVGTRHRRVLDVSGRSYSDRRSTTGFGRRRCHVSIGGASHTDDRGVHGPSAGDKFSSANVEFLRTTMWGAARKPETYKNSLSGRVGGPHDRTRSSKGAQ